MEIPESINNNEEVIRSDCLNLPIEVETVEVLDCDDDVESEYLIKWKGFPKTESSSEPSEHLNEELVDLMSSFIQSAD
ncbi:hypothetical protein Bhyg_11484, partial [Pseudolycoriella hygida]